MEATAAIKATATLIAKVAAWWAKRNDEAFRHERDELFRQWTAELAVALKECLAGLERLEGNAELDRRLDELSGSKEFWRVLDNYGYEAAREAIDDRRKMLAWAAAGSLVARLSVAQMARVERTIRELDPADVAVLRDLERLSPEPFAGAPSANWLASAQATARDRHTLWVETQPSGQVLAAAGCVTIQDYNFQFPVALGSNLTVPTVVPIVTVSELGRWVLAVTAAFK